MLVKRGRHGATVRQRGPGSGMLVERGRKRGQGAACRLRGGSSAKKVSYPDVHMRIFERLQNLSLAHYDLRGRLEGSESYC